MLAVLLSVFINFVLVRVAPGNPISIMAGIDSPNQEMIDTLTQKYGLDKPILVQFGIYLKNLLKGDFGFSYRNSLPVTKLVGERILPTLLLSLTSLLISSFWDATWVFAPPAKKTRNLTVFFKSFLHA